VKSRNIVGLRGFESRGQRQRTRMHKTNSLIMRAPKRSIFEAAADLDLWPKILPHYRYIRFLERGPSRNVVVMAATRSGIPVSWTSEQIIDRDRFEVRFRHLKAFTKGMRVVWSFKDVPEGVLVEIRHDLAFRVPALAPVAEKVIGGFFIHHIANKTLLCMKQYVEENANRIAA
jgi:ribosome-associated toxin RatA of RatAB toxin-antitoxin module